MLAYTLNGAEREELAVRGLQDVMLCHYHELLICTSRPMRRLPTKIWPASRMVLCACRVQYLEQQVKAMRALPASGVMQAPVSTGAPMPGTKI